MLGWQHELRQVHMTYMSLLCICWQLTLDGAHGDHLEAWSARHVVIRLRHARYAKLASSTTELCTRAVRPE